MLKYMGKIFTNLNEINQFIFLSKILTNIFNCNPYLLCCTNYWHPCVLSINSNGRSHMLFFIMSYSMAVTFGMICKSVQGFKKESITVRKCELK